MKIKRRGIPAGHVGLCGSCSQMLHHHKQLAPEPYFSGALYLLYRVALFIRNESVDIRPEQLSDLGDAIHNVPESITEYGRNFDEQRIREQYLAAYDAKWVRSPEDFSLLRTLDAGVERGSKWLAEQANSPD